MTKRSIRYTAIGDGVVMEIGNLPAERLSRFLQDQSKLYRNLFYLDKETDSVTIVKGKVSLEHLNTQHIHIIGKERGNEKRFQLTR